METALEYIQRRLKETNFEPRNPHWSTVSMEDVLKEIIRPEALNWGVDPLDLTVSGTNNEGEHYSYDTSIKKKNPSDEYDYYTMVSLVCDGTMAFWHELLGKAAYRLVKGETYYTLGFKEESPSGYRFIYEVDEAVMLSEYDASFAPEGKPWMCSSFQLYVPIKFSVERLGDKDGKE